MIGGRLTKDQKDRLQDHLLEMFPDLREEITNEVALAVDDFLYMEDAMNDVEDDEDDAVFRD